jgi:hypothetical protein
VKEINQDLLDQYTFTNRLQHLVDFSNQLTIADSRKYDKTFLKYCQLNHFQPMS